VRLTEIFRQARESLIVVNAHRVNRGEMPILERPAAAGGGRTAAPPDFFFFERRTPEEVLETLLHLVAERIPAGFGIDPLADLQVLTPMNRGLLGTENLNRELRARLNPPRPGAVELVRGERVVRAGDKVMQVRNNYELEVFNGDLGRVAAVDAEERQLRVEMDDGRTILYETSDLDELVPAFACSIHKAQGSEYPVVVVPLHSQHYVMLERNLLYTALTRARRLAVLVGEPRALAVAVQNRRNRDRFTRLAERLAPAGGRVAAASPPAQPRRSSSRSGGGSGGGPGSAGGVTAGSGAGSAAGAGSSSGSGAPGSGGTGPGGGPGGTGPGG
jgi:exodeoxyribonuclease V alpha subunit